MNVLANSLGNMITDFNVLRKSKAHFISSYANRLCRKIRLLLLLVLRYKKISRRLGNN